MSWYSSIYSRRGFISFDQVLPTHPSEIRGLNSYHRGKGASGGFSATITITKLKWTTELVDLKLYTTAQTTSSDHFCGSAYARLVIVYGSTALLKTSYKSLHKV